MASSWFPMSCWAEIWIFHGFPWFSSLSELTVCYWTLPKWPIYLGDLRIYPWKWWFSIVFCMFTRGYLAD
jgi:hypothetical protein